MRAALRAMQVNSGPSAEQIKAPRRSAAQRAWRVHRPTGASSGGHPHVPWPPSRSIYMRRKTHEHAAQQRAGHKGRHACKAGFSSASIREVVPATSRTAAAGAAAAALPARRLQVQTPVTRGRAGASGVARPLRSSRCAACLCKAAGLGCGVGVVRSCARAAAREHCWAGLGGEGVGREHEALQRRAAAVGRCRAAEGVSCPGGGQAAALGRRHLRVLD